MKKRLIALLLVIVLLVPAGIASAATWYRVNTSSLKVRYMPGENTTVLGSYRRDYALTVKSTNNGWSLVTFSNGFQGYVQTKYITKGSSYSAWIASDGTSLHKGPDSNFAATATLAKGLKVKVLCQGSGFSYVSTDKFGSGYVKNNFLSKKKVASSGNASTSTVVSGGDYNAYVMNNRKVNLRRDPNTSSPVIAQYDPGTPVYVISHGAVWDKITVGGNTGWMMTKYISTSAPAPVPEENQAAPAVTSDYTAYVVSDNKKPVNVRKGPSKNYSAQFSVPYGAPVYVLKHDTTWDYIKYNGSKGYIMNSFLQLSKPADAGEIVTQDPNATPAPAPVFQEYTTTVKVNDLNFHKQKGDWSSNVDNVGRLQAGWTVKVLKIEGDWAKVEYNGYTGWVHKEFLN